MRSADNTSRILAACRILARLCRILARLCRILCGKAQPFRVTRSSCAAMPLRLSRRSFGRLVGKPEAFRTECGAAASRLGPGSATERYLTYRVAVLTQLSRRDLILLQLSIGHFVGPGP